MRKIKEITIGAVRLMWWICIAGSFMMAVSFDSTPTYFLTGLFVVGVVVTELTIIQKMLAGLQYLVSDDYKHRAMQGKVVGIDDQKPMEN